MTGQWRRCAGHDVWVEDGLVVRGLSKDGTRTVWPYRTSRRGGWERAEGVKLNTLRTGLYKGTWRMI